MPPCTGSPRRNFNPRTHVGCDHQPRAVHHPAVISIHAPTWGATQDTIGLNFNPKFQSTHPRGVRLCLCPETFVYQDFNPRTHVGCDSSPIAAVSFQRNFNPRTHVGCDFTLAPCACALEISIHAPTWGATLVTNFYDFVSRFQSTHPRGVRLMMIGIVTAEFNFNPRTHVGCDLLLLALVQFLGNFNPRTHVGCDFLSLRCMPTNPEFQSTHPRGVRRGQATTTITVVNFNPRTHVGCDFRINRGLTFRTNFNPRTHVGCDIRADASRGGHQISIHAPTWGATKITINLCLMSGISIHAPTWGATACQFL